MANNNPSEMFFKKLLEKSTGIPKSQMLYLVTEGFVQHHEFLTASVNEMDS